MTRFKNKDLKNNELYIALKQLQNKRSYDTFDRFIISKKLQQKHAITAKVRRDDMV